MAKVRIINGSVRNEQIHDEVFHLVSGFRSNGKGSFVTVRNENRFADCGAQVRVRVNNDSDFEILGKPSIPRVRHMAEAIGFSMPVEAAAPIESDDDAMNRIAKRFAILDQMTRATINGDVRAMIVSGPPGVGKSFGVEQQLENASMFDRLASKKIRYEVVKGAMTALGLYAQLYKFSDPKNVLVFDDCDSVFSDELSLNLLKAALDSGKRRRIFWNSDSSMLRREGIPDNFDFRGSVIFITNVDFSNVKSKKMQDHLEALQSRCHYLDLTIHTERDRMLRVRQVHRDVSQNHNGGLFADYEFDNSESDEILDYMWQNRNRLREISLRMALKIADLVKVNPLEWRDLAAITVCKPS